MSDPKHFHDHMLALSEITDPEERHRRMDRAMCYLLEELGYVEAVNVFISTEKWYA